MKKIYALLLLVVLPAPASHASTSIQIQGESASSLYAQLVAMGATETTSDLAGGMVQATLVGATAVRCSAEAGINHVSCSAMVLQEKELAEAVFSADSHIALFMSLAHAGAPDTPDDAIVATTVSCTFARVGTEPGIHLCQISF
mgnify:CR=1 FL=1